MRTAARSAALLSTVWLVIEMIRGGIPWTPSLFVALSVLWNLHAKDPGRLWKDHPDAVIFLVTLAFYLSTFRWRGGDDIPASILPIAVLRYGTLALDPVLDPWLTGKAANFILKVGDHSLSLFSIVPGILAIPVYVLPMLAGVVPSETFLHNLSKISASLITAFSAVAFHRAVRLRSSAGWALALTAFYALGSFSFSLSSQGLWEHGPAQLGLALGLWGLAGSGPRYDALAGAGFGLAFAARPDTALFAAGAGAFLLFHAPKRLPGFALGSAVPIGLIAAYWLYYTGSLLPPELDFHSTKFVGLQWDAFFAFAASPTRGMLFFFPLTAFGVWNGLRRGRQPMTVWLLFSCLASWLLVSNYEHWTGGMSFGPRYLSSAMVILAFLCADLENTVRHSPRLLKVWVWAGTAGILVHALGAYLNWPGSHGFHAAEAQAWRLDLHPAAFIFTSEGGLQGLPWPLRCMIGIVILGAFAALAKTLEKRLTPVRLGAPR